MGKMSPMQAGAVPALSTEYHTVPTSLLVMDQNL